jgi:hypothetical protein
MTRIELGDYTLAADDNCWTVYQRKVAGEKSRNPGEVSEVPVSYHGKLAQALDRLLDLDLRDCDARSIRELRNELESARHKLAHVASR